MPDPTKYIAALYERAGQNEPIAIVEIVSDDSRLFPDILQWDGATYVEIGWEHKRGSIRKIYRVARTEARSIKLWDGKSTTSPIGHSAQKIPGVDMPLVKAGKTKFKATPLPPGKYAMPVQEVAPKKTFSTKGRDLIKEANERERQRVLAQTAKQFTKVVEKKIEAPTSGKVPAWKLKEMKKAKKGKR